MGRYAFRRVDGRWYDITGGGASLWLSEGVSEMYRWAVQRPMGEIIISLSRPLFTPCHAYSHLLAVSLIPKTGRGIAAFPTMGGGAQCEGIHSCLTSDHLVSP